MSSNDIAISAHNVSKSYTITHNAPKRPTFRDMVMDRVNRPFRKPERETFWALQDVSFEVKKGEVVGIIGRNGAGKSTLLKILSQITEPTRGRIDLYSRVGSLLEVGTGFHPELTGRENIYLNGTILGMRRSEVARQFDEIVEFAEVERFLDTPVKRYSSGMYVRLAFAVAAHLQLDILLVDEVLSVGDAAFQRKCLGKMTDVASEGRTVLFVSHNMGAVLGLCKTAMLLANGKLITHDTAPKVVHGYLSTTDTPGDGVFIRHNFVYSRDLIVGVEMLDATGRRCTTFSYGEALELRIRTNASLSLRFGIEVRLKNSNGDLLGYVSSWIQSQSGQGFLPGDTLSVRIPSLPLVQDRYYLDVICRIPLVYHVDVCWDCLSFQIVGCRPGNSPIALDAADRMGAVVIRDASVAVIGDQISDGVAPETAAGEDQGTARHA
jgi:lipopolysaccharide transport system ATP-binding protein